MIMLTNNDRKRIVSRYSDRFKEYGIDLRTINPGKWNKLEIQHHIHASIGDLNNKTILDIGCGLGHYYQFLLNKGLKINYIGYDIVGDFIKTNQERFPNAIFEQRDISCDEIVHKADYAVMCQVFNNRYENGNNDEVVKNALRKAFQAVSIGVSLDLRTNYVNYREDHLYYFSPEEYFTFAKSLTPFVMLRHDYLPFDFTIFLYKEGTFKWG
jgi:SAM-dependent methyltransferase